MTRLHFLMILLLLAVGLVGQQPPAGGFDHYTLESGLSNNTTTGIAQDARGYIWIATASGLNRFNGSRFVQFHSNDDSLSLPAEIISSMAWLDKYRMAVLTLGLHIVDTRTGMTKNVLIPYHDKRYQFKFNFIERVLGDENGHLFIAGRSFKVVY